MRQWQANVLGSLVALLVVVGGLIISAPEAEANGPSNPMRLVAPPATGHGVSEIPLSEGLELWGQPSRLNMFWTSDSSDEVARTYADSWRAAGFEPTIRKTDHVTSISMMDKSTGLLRTVTVLDQKDERVVIPGLTDIRVAPDLTPRHAPVPVPENARVYMAHVDDDGSSVSYSGSFLVPIRPADVAEFYRVELKKLGYRLSDNPTVTHIKSGEVVEFLRGAESVQIVATRPDAGQLNDVIRSGQLDKKFDPDGTALVMVTHTRMLEPEGAPAGSKP